MAADASTLYLSVLDYFPPSSSEPLVAEAFRATIWTEFLIEF